jgi:putative flavoprotein involved in K+ transport
VAVIGGGQAGLAIGYCLSQQACRFMILERASELAPAWRERWDSLELFTSRRYSAPRASVRQRPWTTTQPGAR